MTPEPIYTPENTRPVHNIKSGMAGQVGKSDYVDPRFKDYLTRFTVDDPEAVLNSAFRTGHGEYWCNLHLDCVF